MLSLDLLKMKLFKNCRFVLVGYNKDVETNMVNEILTNGGSIIAVNSFSNATHIICEKKTISDSLHKDLEFLPKSMYKYAVYSDWIRDSIDLGYLLNLTKYRVFSDLPCGSFSDFEANEIVDEVNKSEEMLGYDPIQISAEKRSEKENKLCSLMKEFIDLVNSKHILIRDFVELKTKVIPLNDYLKVFFDAFHDINEFFISFNHAARQFNHESGDDRSYVMGIFQAYIHINNSYHQYYNIYLSTFVEITKQIKEHSNLKSVLDDFCKVYNVTNIFYVINLPIKFLLTLGNLFDEIISCTSCFNPELVFWNNIVQLNKEVLNSFNTIENSINEHQKYLLISRCLGETILSEKNPYWTCVDCMVYFDRNEPFPSTMFIFNESIMIFKFKYPNIAQKRYDKIIEQLKFYDNIREKEIENIREKETDNFISEQNDSQNLKGNPIISRSASRCSSIESFNNSEKSTAFKMQLAKFQKIFTGLSKLNINKDSGLYSDYIEIEKSDILKISHNPSEKEIEKRLLFTLSVFNSETKLCQPVELQLMPRRIEKLTKYKDIKTAFPKEIEWESLNDQRRWDCFILEEIENFHYFLSQMFIASRKQSTKSFVSIEEFKPCKSLKMSNNSEKQLSIKKISKKPSFTSFLKKRDIRSFLKKLHPNK